MRSPRRRELLEKHGNGAGNGAGNGTSARSEFSERDMKRIKAEAELCKAYMRDGMAPMDAVRKLARCVALGPWENRVWKPRHRNGNGNGKV